MTNTRKFSEFVDGGNLENNQTTVGLAAGANTKFNNPWTLLAPGTTAERPAPSASVYFRLRFNTTLSAYEYLDSNGDVWLQLDHSGSVLSVTGTANEVDVDNTDPQNPILSLSATLDAPGTFTIQSSIAADEIINDDTMATASATNLPTALSVKNYVDGLDSGSVKSVTGTANQVDVDNTDPQNPVLSLPATLDAPGTIAVGNLFLDTNTISSTDTNGDLNLTPDGTGDLVLDGVNWPQADGNAGYFLQTDGLGQTSWQPVAGSGTVNNGTANQIAYYATTGDAVSGLTGGNSALLVTDATGAPSMTASLTDGQIVIGDTSGTPTPATITPGTGIAISNGAGSITISATGGGFGVATVSGTSQAAAVNTMYILLNAGQTTVTLPSTFSVGDTVILVGSSANAGGWVLTAASGDTIMYLGTATSAGGTITSVASAGQTIEVVCDVANTSWVVVDTASVTLTTA